MVKQTPTLQQASAAVARLRAEGGVTQTAVAEKAGLDQSRVSRIEKGEVSVAEEIDRVLDALAKLGVKKAGEYKTYAAREWQNIEPPSFWNPERASLEIAEETLGQIANFLGDDEHPWPLRRQIERHQESMLRATTFLSRLNHNVAFLGDVGVGKSTAISFIFDLLMPASTIDKPINRPILETGAGGTTICEVHIKGGPEFGISLVPMSESELRSLVADFCATKWMILTKAPQEPGESISVSREVERAIRNMSGLTRRRETVDGKPVFHDPINDLALSCANEEEFRTFVLGKMSLSDRTQRELWYDSATRQHPMEWVTETFKAVNNGRLKDVPLPQSIDLLIPDFGRSFGELDIAVIDTKGVDDVAIREDLDARLKDSRTAVVFCCGFREAPGNTTRLLLQHMRQTFSDRVDTGKVAILALPRAAEARAMKDDMDQHVLTDIEGYEFKRIQVSSELAAADLGGVPMMFFNVESDDPATIRTELFEQLNRMRKTVEQQLVDLCDAVQDIIQHHEAKALNAAIEEVANRLNTFLKGNRSLGAREQLAHVEAIGTVKGVRYAATLWAATRRSGEYPGLNIVHLIGVGAVRDAKLRSDNWFKGFDAFLRSLKADEGLALAARTIGQIADNAVTSKLTFLEGTQRAAVEVYREPLTQAPVWADCIAEWGLGKGFKLRVADHLEQWFASKAKLKEVLEDIVNRLWDQSVISPLLQLGDASGSSPGPVASNVTRFPSRISA